MRLGPHWGHRAQDLPLGQRVQANRCHDNCYLWQSTRKEMLDSASQDERHARAIGDSKRPGLPG